MKSLTGQNQPADRRLETAGPRDRCKSILSVFLWFFSRLIYCESKRFIFQRRSFNCVSFTPYRRQVEVKDSGFIGRGLPVTFHAKTAPTFVRIHEKINGNLFRMIFASFVVQTYAINAYLCVKFDVSLLPCNVYSPVGDGERNSEFPAFYLSVR